MTPTVDACANQSASISPAVSIRCAAPAPASRATSTSRTEFEEFAEPTTIATSHRPPIALTAACRFWVA